MPAVTFHRITDFNREQVLGLRVAPHQERLVATTEKSLIQAKADSNLHPFAVYDVRSRGLERPTEPVIGFAMVEIVAGVGFIMRVLIDQQYQGKGYGKAMMVEVIRRLKLYPDVELITVSHRRANVVMAGLLKSLGFVPWDVPFADEDPDQLFLRLEKAEAAE